MNSLDFGGCPGTCSLDLVYIGELYFDDFQDTLTMDSTRSASECDNLRLLANVKK